MFNVISFEKLLKITAEDLAVIKENLGSVYMDEKVDPEIKYLALAEAFNKIEEWSSYYHRFKKIQDSKLYELTRKNAGLEAENERLVNDNNKLNKESQESRDKLNKELQESRDKLSKAHYRIGTLQATLEAKNNNSSSNMVQVDLVELIEKLGNAVNMIDENAKVITQSKRVKSKGEIAPAFNNEVRTEDVIKAYQLGETPNQIANKCGMTQSGIIYRLKQAGVYVGKGKPGRPEK